VGPMLKTLGVVDACFTSTGSMMGACRRLGGKPALEWIIRKMTDCQQLDGVLVVTNDAAHNRIIERLVPLDIPVFMTNETQDALDRLVDILEEYPTKALVRVCCDYPFLDPVLVDRLVTDAEVHSECDYVTYCLRDGRPAVLSSLGLYVEWFRADALRRASREARYPEHREDASYYLRSHPEAFTLRMLPAPPVFDRPDMCLSLASEDDWEQMLTIFEVLGPDGLEWQRIADLLDRHPTLRDPVAAMDSLSTKD